MSAAEDNASTSGRRMLSTAQGVQKGRPKKRKNGRLTSGTNLGFGNLGHGLSSCLVSSGSDIGLNTHGESPNSQGGRTKRMRTSFKHHQLRSMKAYFALNHNPDAKDLKQLAQKTGLTKRVLQVWFQNARAKYRRATHGRSGSAGSENMNPCSPKSIPETSSEHNASFSDSNNATHQQREDGSHSVTPGLISGQISSEPESLASPEDGSGGGGGEMNPFSAADISDDSASTTLAEYFENERGFL